VFPTIDEYYQLQLQQVVSEPYPQRRWNRSGAHVAVLTASSIQQPGGSANPQLRGTSGASARDF
jgi:hypothetical protein